MSTVDEITPVQREGDFYLKRDDLFEIYGVHGGKARAGYMLILKAIQEGKLNIVTAGSRFSPQCEIVSYICQQLKITNHLFMPEGPETTVIQNINNNYYSDIHRVKYGYNNVICSRAKQFAMLHNYYYLPFGLECPENIEITCQQVKNIPADVQRIVVPIGSGMSFISICNGLQLYNRHEVEVLGVQVGKSPDKNIEKYLDAPDIKYRIVKAEEKYDKQIHASIGGIELDPVYEAKCFRYMRPGDCLWIVGHRKTNIEGE